MIHYNGTMGSKNESMLRSMRFKEGIQAKDKRIFIILLEALVMVHAVAVFLLTWWINTEIRVLHRVHS